jgi:hypothetical protein
LRSQSMEVATPQSFLATPYHHRHRAFCLSQGQVTARRFVVSPGRSLSRHRHAATRDEGGNQLASDQESLHGDHHESARARVHQMSREQAQSGQLILNDRDEREKLAG